MIKNKILGLIFLVSAILLSLFYFFIIDPISGGWGGLIYFLGGRFLPSIINLLLASGILIFIIGIFKINNFILKIVLFILLSLILGVNTRLPYIFDIFLQPKNIQIQILSPLHRLPAVGIPAINFSLPEIANSLLSTLELGGNEGCGCMYFDPPLSLNARIIADTAKLLGYKTSIEYGYYIELPTMSYKFSIDGMLKSKKILVQIKIQDKLGGHVIISAEYPEYLQSPSTRRIEGLKNDPQYKMRIVDLLLHNNFWQYILDIQTPLSRLTDAQIKNLFVQ